MGEADTEDRILDAALSVFSKKGKDGARMQEIADEAGINKALLHYYFRSKDRLYEAVFRNVFTQFTLQHAQSVREAPTFAETLKSFIDGFIESIRQKPDIVRLMVNENLAGGNTLGRLITEKTHESAPPSILKLKLTEAVESREIRAVNVEHTLLTILSCCLFFFIWAPTIRIKVPDSKRWDTFVDARKTHIFELLYQGMIHPEVHPSEVPDTRERST